MLYRSEVWTIKKDDEKKVEAEEMWFYRRVLRIKWTDKRTNDSVLQELSTKKSLLNIINERKLKYIGHAIRNPKTELMKTVTQGKIQSPRRRGRPPTTYISTITKSSGLGLQEISQRSMDREKWRCLAKSACVAANVNHDDADR